MEKISVIIPTMKGREEMLQRLISTIPPGCEIVIVDDEDLLLAAKRNKGAAQATGDFLLFIDDDNYIRDGSCLMMMSRHFLSGKVGVVGMTACYDDNKLFIADGGSVRNYLTGFTRGINTNLHLYNINSFFYEVDEVANAFMISRKVFDEVGGFDELDFPIDLDEADICKRIKDLGYKIKMNSLAICYHKSQTYSHIPNFRRSLNAYFMGRNRVLYQRKHNTFLHYCLYLIFFNPVFVCFYTGSLIYRKNPKMIFPFLKGVFDGVFNRRENKYQKRKMREGRRVSL